MKKISIVTPTLNEEKHIGQLLRMINAIKKEVPYEIEVIVCDGNSTDRTREIAGRYADKVLIETKRSAAAERQRGAANATGDIIMFIDSDSVPSKNWVRNMIRAFENSDVVVATGALYPLEKSPLEEWAFGTVLTPLVKISTMLGMPMVYGINLAVRRDIFIKVGGFNLKYVTGEDSDLVRRMRKYGKFVYVPGSVVYTSIRRLQKMGRMKFLVYHLVNHFRTYALNRPYGKYENIR